MSVIVLPHDPAWSNAFDAEAGAIRDAFGAPITLFHIGSTSIPGILAKPIIDLLAGVEDLARVDQDTAAFEGLGYEALGAFGIDGRRYFRKITKTGVRTHHLHIFANGSPQIERHLAFRDYLRAMPEVAAAYSDLKARLTRTDVSSEDYMDGKDPFIKRVEQDALLWAKTRT